MLIQQLFNLLIEKFPDGYVYNDIMRFETRNGETIQALEIRTDDAIYLVRIGAKLEKLMDDYADENLDDDFIFEDFIDAEDIQYLLHLIFKL